MNRKINNNSQIFYGQIHITELWTNLPDDSFRKFLQNAFEKTYFKLFLYTWITFNIFVSIALMKKHIRSIENWNKPVQTLDPLFFYT